MNEEQSVIGRAEGRSGEPSSAAATRVFRGPERCALRSDRPKRRTVALRASVSSDRRAQGMVLLPPIRTSWREATDPRFPDASRASGEQTDQEQRSARCLSSDVRDLRRMAQPTLGGRARPADRAQGGPSPPDGFGGGVSIRGRPNRGHPRRGFAWALSGSAPTSRGSMTPRVLPVPIVIEPRRSAAARLGPPRASSRPIQESRHAKMTQTSLFLLMA
jgi:hypothetical protein